MQQHTDSISIRTVHSLTRPVHSLIRQGRNLIRPVATHHSRIRDRRLMPGFITIQYIRRWAHHPLTPIPWVPDILRNDVITKSTVGAMFAVVPCLLFYIYYRGRAVINVVRTCSPTPLLKMCKPRHIQIRLYPSLNYCLSPSSRNCIFQNLTFLKDLKKNITMSPFCIPKVLKSATKFLKIGLTKIDFMPDNNFYRAFSSVKMSAREVTIFPEKSLSVIFHLK